MTRRLLGLLACLLPTSPRAAAADPPTSPTPAGVDYFESKVRPVLVEYCYKCHSAQAEKLKGGLYLDTRAGVLHGGDNGPAVVPGKPDESRLVRAVRWADEDLRMPPKTRLPADAVAALEKWVAMGAPDPRAGDLPPAAAGPAKKGIDIEAARATWAFRPLVAADPPAVTGAGWARTPVDRFILAKLDDKGLSPNLIASKTKLVRRAYFDLTGLPPTPAEAEGFVNDSSPDAWEKLVDRLLASPRYGERWARHWLDVARFAESGGYEFDGDRKGAYHYRDWVIRALNDDMPYDRFVRLQLAGDKLRPGDYAAGAATGFIVAGPYPGQTTQKTLEPIRYDHLDDMVSTIGSGLLGLTVGCARCHDHKYDPIPTRDYYRLVACLGRTDSGELKLDPEPAVYKKAKAEYDAAHAPLAAAWEAFQKEQLPARFEAWQSSETSRQQAAAKWLALDWVTATAKADLTTQDDGSVLAGGKAEKGGKGDTYTLVAHTNLKGITAIRLEALADPSLPKSGPGRGEKGEFRLTRIDVKAAPQPGGKGKPADVKLRPVTATTEADGQPLADAIPPAPADKGKKDAAPAKKPAKPGWSTGPGDGKDQAAVFEVDGDLGYDGGTVLTVTLKFDGDAPAIGRPRVSITTAPRPATADGDTALQNAREIAAVLASSDRKADDKNREQVDRWFRRLDAEAWRLYRAVDDHTKAEPKPNLAGVFAAADKGGDVYFLGRGDTGKKDGVATPGFLQVLTTAPNGEKHWTGPIGMSESKDGKPPAKVEPRVALAEWVTDTDRGAGNLLARVIVNRLWQHHLGRGIVATPNDFGTQGDPPSHPELLDYLAAELVRNGWRLKPIHKLILTSAVYMQDGGVSDTGQRADPDNHLLWRRPARRLEAEAVRDSLLAIGGTLDTTMYGPGMMDENGPRRSVYLTVKRSKPVPLLQLFDAPEAMQSTGRRQTTTVPTQALAMMNSPLVRQSAERLARRARQEAGGAADVGLVVDRAYRIAFGRPPTDAERDPMAAFIREQADGYAADAKTDKTKAADQAFADFCQLLLCSSEFVYVD